LGILGTLRAELGTSIPLAWAPDRCFTRCSDRGLSGSDVGCPWIRSTGYKKRDQTEKRREIITALRTKLTIGESVRDLATSADLVDAAVCVLAGADFISGRAMGPENRTLAEREGWIWTAAPHT
jgi:hypothetical protein